MPTSFTSVRPWLCFEFWSKRSLLFVRGLFFSAPTIPLLYLFCSSVLGSNYSALEFTDLIEHDVMPDPKVIEAALRACRRLNDFGLTIRILEAVQLKCSHGIFKWGRKKIFAWIMQEVCKFVNCDFDYYFK